MKLNEVIEIQIDTAIAGLLHTRAKLGGRGNSKESFREIDQQLEAVSFHLQDIHYNWLSLMQSHQA